MVGKYTSTYEYDASGSVSDSEDYADGVYSGNFSNDFDRYNEVIDFTNYGGAEHIAGHVW